MAFGANTKATWDVQAIITEDAPDPELLQSEKYVDLLVYREFDWESKIVEDINKHSCEFLKSNANMAFKLKL